MMNQILIAKHGKARSVGTDRDRCDHAQQDGKEMILSLQMEVGKIGVIRVMELDLSMKVIASRSPFPLDFRLGTIQYHTNRNNG